MSWLRQKKAYLTLLLKNQRTDLDLNGIPHLCFLLDVENVIDIFCLHLCFLAKMNTAFDQFRRLMEFSQAGNRMQLHSVRTFRKRFSESNPRKRGAPNGLAAVLSEER